MAFIACKNLLAVLFMWLTESFGAESFVSGCSWGSEPQKPPNVVVTASRQKRDCCPAPLYILSLRLKILLFLAAICLIQWIFFSSLTDLGLINWRLRLVYIIIWINNRKTVRSFLEKERLRIMVLFRALLGRFHQIRSQQYPLRAALPQKILRIIFDLIEHSKTHGNALPEVGG